jgi:hypothetical protein
MQLYDDVINPNALQVSLKQESEARWRGTSEGFEVVARTKEACLVKIREVSGARPRILVVEVAPLLAGVAEAARILGWDKRRVATYVQRGSFPEPMASLAGGRIWTHDEIVAFAKRFRGRRKRRAGPKAGPR